MTITVDQLEAMSVYAPPRVMLGAAANPDYQPGGTWRRFYAATLFADISGFTPLAEALATQGVRGAEELTSILNRVFEALISAVETYGGQVVKFGGDALSIMWPCPQDAIQQTVIEALHAATAMQSCMLDFKTVQAGQRFIELKMKIGISAGELLRSSCWVAFMVAGSMFWPVPLWPI